MCIHRPFSAELCRGIWPGLILVAAICELVQKPANHTMAVPKFNQIIAASGRLHRLLCGCSHRQDSLAEWSKALASGASPQGRGFEPHSCHFTCQQWPRCCSLFISHGTWFKRDSDHDRLAHTRGAAQPRLACRRPQLGIPVPQNPSAIGPARESVPAVGRPRALEGRAWAPGAQHRILTVAFAIPAALPPLLARPTSSWLSEISPRCPGAQEPPKPMGSRLGFFARPAKLARLSCPVASIAQW